MSSGTAEAAEADTKLCLLLACFDGAHRASRIRRPLGKRIQQGGDAILDEVILRIGGKGNARVHDPRRTVAGALTPALTWGVFGLLSADEVSGLVIWAVIGALCGGLYAYLAEHLLSKSELTRIGGHLPPDSSALVAFVEAGDAKRVIAAGSEDSPTVASAAGIGPDLSARTFSGAAETPAASVGQAATDTNTLLSMLLWRYPGKHTAHDAAKKLSAAGSSEDKAVKVELLVAVDEHGRPHVSDPSQGVGAMAKTDVLGWGVFGVAFGLIVGFAGDGGVLSSLEDGLVTGIAWGVFGLVAGVLYGLWAGRGVSARRLKGLRPLLPPDTSLLLAWAGGSVPQETITLLSTPDAVRLILGFKPVEQGAVLEAQ